MTHSSVVELEDGKLLAIGRGENIDGHSPMSISDNMGKTWTHYPSPFPPIGGGQRSVLMRLNEGPIIYVSFTDYRNSPRQNGMIFTDIQGNKFRGHGVFAALSFDEGRTWPRRKLITPADNREYFARHRAGGSYELFIAAYDNAEN